MALIIPDYKYIQHKLKPRPWGPEVQFTVARSDGSHINEVIPIPDLKIEDKALAELIVNALKRIDVPPPPPPPDPIEEAMKTAEANKEAEIKSILEAKGLLEKGQEIIAIPTKQEIINAAKESEVIGGIR